MQFQEIFSSRQISLFSILKYLVREIVQLQNYQKRLHLKIRVAVEAKEETKIHAEIETEQKAAEEEARLKAEEEVKMTTHSFVC